MAGLESPSGETGPRLGVSLLHVVQESGLSPRCAPGERDLDFQVVALSSPKRRIQEGESGKGGRPDWNRHTAAIPPREGPPRGREHWGTWFIRAISGHCTAPKPWMRELGADGCYVTSPLTQSLVSLWERKRPRCTWVCTYVCTHMHTYTQVKPCEGRSQGEVSKVSSL